MSYDSYFSAAKKAKKSDPGAQPALSPAKEELLKELMSQRIQNQKSLRISKAKKSLNPRWVMAAALCFAFALVGYAYPQAFDPVLDHVEIGFLGFAQAQDAANNNQPKADNAAAAAETKAEEEKSPYKEFQAWTEEDFNHFKDLVARKEALDSREKELEKLESELQKQKSEIERRMTKLQKIRREISSVLSARVNEDQEKVKKLVEFYSNMKPAKAAKIFGEINEDLAVEILGQMKKKNAAQIMNLLEPVKAQKLSEKFAGYRTK